MLQTRKFSQQSALATYTGLISVANCGLIFASSARHPNGFMATTLQEFKGQKQPALKIYVNGAVDRWNFLSVVPARLE
jgi:hypothetical protein